MLLVTYKSEKKFFLEKQYASALANFEQKPYGASLSSHLTKSSNRKANMILLESTC